MHFYISSYFKGKFAVVYKRGSVYECHAFSCDDPTRLEDFCRQLNDFISLQKLSKASSLTSLIDDKVLEDNFITECEYCGSSPIVSHDKHDIREVHRIIHAHSEQGRL